MKAKIWVKTLMSHLFSKSPAKLREIKSTQFGIFSPEEVIANSVVEIEYHELHESKGVVKRGGLLDSRLGVIVVRLTVIPVMKT